MNNLRKIIAKCYYFCDIIKIEDFDFDNILLDEKSYENVLVDDISSKTFTGAKPLRIRFDEVEGFIGVYNGTRNLVLFGNNKVVLWYYICFFRIIMQK